MPGVIIVEGEIERKSFVEKTPFRTEFKGSVHFRLHFFKRCRIGPLDAAACQYVGHRIGDIKRNVIAYLAPGGSDFTQGDPVVRLEGDDTSYKMSSVLGVGKLPEKAGEKDPDRGSEKTDKITEQLANADLKDTGSEDTETEEM